MRRGEAHKKRARERRWESRRRVKVRYIRGRTSVAGAASHQNSWRLDAVDSWQQQLAARRCPVS